MPSLHTGGTERQVVTLLQGLHELDAGRHITLVTMVDGGELATELAGCCDVRTLGLHSVRTAPGSLWRLVSLLRETRPQVVYTLLSPANFVLAVLRPLLGRSRPRLVWGIRGEAPNLGGRRWQRWASRWLTGFLSRSAVRVIVNSEAVRRYAASVGVPDAKISVVENGVDAVRFRPAIELGQSFRASVGIGRDELLVVALGRLVADKDYPNLLRSLALATGPAATARVLIIGQDPGGEADRLGDLARQLGIGDRVQIVGRRPDPEAALNAADLVVLSSRAEGSPNVVLEALACGATVAATRVGDVGELLDQRFTAPRDDPSALAGAIEAALADVGRERVSRLPDRYRTDRLVTRTLSVLDTALQS